MRRMLAAFVFTLVTALAMPGQDIKPGPPLLAPHPPMGWNSWDSYGLTITEAEFKANADWMAKFLKRFGWQYVVVDEGWFLQNPQSEGKPAWIYTLDQTSRYVPAENRFPSAASGKGFQALADYTHSLGLKFGLHILRGISREAVAKNMPIADSPFHAAQAADTYDSCPWNSDNYGVKDNAAGQAYYDSIAKLYASWNVDFIKVDCISSRPYKETEIRMISRALAKADRPIVLSLSPGPTSLANANNVRQYAQMWRISDDFWDHWGESSNPEMGWAQSLHDQFATAVGWAPYAGPGHWPDADMLPIGYIGPRPGVGKARETNFTRDEQRTLMTLWSIIRSPLILGSDLTRNDDWTTSLLTNPEVIAVDQHSRDNRPLIVTSHQVVWTARPETGTGTYLAVFNRGNGELELHLGWNELGLKLGRAYKLRDLWERKDLAPATELGLKLAPHNCVLYRASE
jgi:alpha-galactosidase